MPRSRDRVNSLAGIRSHAEAPTALIAMLIAHLVIRTLGQEQIAIVPSQEQEIVDALNAGRLDVSPLPCTPLLSVSWDSVLGFAALAHASQCTQTRQAPAERRQALDAIAADLGIPVTDGVIGQSISVLVTSEGDPLGLANAVRTNFLLGAMSYNHTMNLCVSSTGVISASTTLQCRQYIDMVTQSVTSVGCSVTQCSQVSFGGDSAPMQAPQSSAIYVVNCLYAPIGAEFQSPNGDVIATPYMVGCASPGTGNATEITPTMSPPSTPPVAPTALPEVTTSVATVTAATMETVEVTTPFGETSVTTANVVAGQGGARAGAVDGSSSGSEDGAADSRGGSSSGSEDRASSDSSSDSDDECRRRRRRRRRILLRLRSRSSSSDSGSASQDSDDDSYSDEDCSS